MPKIEKNLLKVKGTDGQWHYVPAVGGGSGGGADITITDTAEVGEVLTVEEVDSEGKPTKWKTEKPTAEQKQADWEQNDETAADYVKNRTHYDSRVEETVEKSFTLTSESAQMQKLFDDFNYDDIAKLKSIHCVSKCVNPDDADASWDCTDDMTVDSTTDISDEYSLTEGSIYLIRALVNADDDGVRMTLLYLIAKEEALSNEEITSQGMTTLGLYYDCLYYAETDAIAESETITNAWTIVRETGELKTIEPKYIYYSEEKRVNIAGYGGDIYDIHTTSYLNPPVLLPFEIGQIWSVHDFTNDKDYANLSVQLDDENNLYIGDTTLTSIPFVIYTNNIISDIRATISITGVSGTFSETAEHQIPQQYVEQVQSDWNENDETAKSYVKNRPFYTKPPVLITTKQFWLYTDAGLRGDTGNTILSYFDNHRDSQFRAVINGVDCDFTVSFDRGYWCGGGDISFRVGYSSNTNWEITVKKSDIASNLPSVCRVTFYDVTPVYVTLPDVYFPDSIFSQNNAPVIFGDGKKSTVQGEDNTASGDYSHVEGKDNTASGDYSHVEGGMNKSTGRSSHAEGWATTASGSVSHSEGHLTTASGESSHAEGGFSDATGKYSHAEGDYTIASGECSHAEGDHTIARHRAERVIGRCNIDEEVQSYAIKTFSVTTTLSGTVYYSGSYQFDSTTGEFTLVNPQLYDYSAPLTNIYVSASSPKEIYYIVSITSTETTSAKVKAVKFFGSLGGVGWGDYVFVVGNGLSDITRSNAYTLDWDGNGWFSGDVYVGSTSGTNRDDGSVRLLKENSDIPVNSVIINSSTSGSTKKFKLTVDDSGTISATEVTE